MKESYEKPKLTVHGTVEEMTQAFGESNATDTFFYGGRGYPGDGGSTDGVVVPQ